MVGPRVTPLPDALPFVVRRVPVFVGNLPAFQPGANYGEEIRRLHARGITGRGVGIAIIDQPLLASHREFTGRLRWYDEIDVETGDRAGWHSTAVASIAVGNTIGVAPEADLYFIGIGMIYNRELPDNFVVGFRRAAHTGQPIAVAIRRILAMNKRLDEGRKIRAISISIGFGPEMAWLDETPAAVAEARAAGLFVSHLDLKLQPLGPVTVASAAADDAYFTHGIPAVSWAIPYLAGRYALACQERPGLRPEEFLREQK
ncbi:MAG: S8 family serine peptidase [Bryobacteraceae bacterium]